MPRAITIRPDGTEEVSPRGQPRSGATSASRWTSTFISCSAQDGCLGLDR